MLEFIIDVIISRSTSKLFQVYIIMALRCSGESVNWRISSHSDDWHTSYIQSRYCSTSVDSIVLLLDCAHNTMKSSFYKILYARCFTASVAIWYKQSSFDKYLFFFFLVFSLKRNSTHELKPLIFKVIQTVRPVYTYALCTKDCLNRRNQTQ